MRRRLPHILLNAATLKQAVVARRLLIVGATIAAIVICLFPPWQARFRTATGAVIPYGMGHLPFFARPAEPPDPGFPMPKGTTCTVAVDSVGLLAELVGVVLVLQWAAFGAQVVARANRYLRQYRAHSLRRRGLCPTCGYDLRATPDRCPECGHPPTHPDPTRTASTTRVFPP